MSVPNDPDCFKTKAALHIIQALSPKERKRERWCRYAAAAVASGRRVDIGEVASYADRLILAEKLRFPDPE